MSPVSRVGNIANCDGKVLTIGPDDSIASAARKMSSNQVGCLMVADKKGMVVGIMTERDVIRNIFGKSMDPKRKRVKDVMIRKVVACTMSTSITRAQQVMARHNIRHVPIIENGKPVGMISSRDILSHQLATVRAIARKQSMIINNIEDQHPGITHLVQDTRGRIVI